MGTDITGQNRNSKGELKNDWIRKNEKPDS